jgi:hypothetical protein
MQLSPLRLRPLRAGAVLIAFAILAFCSLESSYNHVREEVFLAAALAAIVGSALVVWGLTPPTAAGGWGAACMVIAVFWAFCAGFSACFDASSLDPAIVLVGSVLAFARIYRMNAGWRLLALAAPLAVLIVMSHAWGGFIRAFGDDPRM